MRSWPSSRRDSFALIRRWPIRAALTLTLVGCEAAPVGPPMAPTRGSVYYRGQPLDDALVVFSPIDGERMAQGRTDAQGRFELRTFRPGDGALLGPHRVSVTALGPAREMTPEEKAAGVGDVYVIPGDPRIPERYFSADASGLAADVTADGPNDFRFDLAD